MFTLIPEQILRQRRANTPRPRFLMKNINQNMGQLFNQCIKNEKTNRTSAAATFHVYTQYLLLFR